MSEKKEREREDTIKIYWPKRHYWSVYFFISRWIFLSFWARRNLHVDSNVNVIHTVDVTKSVAHDHNSNHAFLCVYHVIVIFQ